MQRDVTRAASLFGRWLMGEDLLAAVDAEHGTNLSPMAQAATAKIAQVRDEVERTIAAREANVAVREQVTQEAREYLKPEPMLSPGTCETCKGMGARRIMINDVAHAVLCGECGGTGKVLVCETCNGDGAILVEMIGGPPRPRPCTACKATGKKQP